jgi:hypothetical protein
LKKKKAPPKVPEPPKEKVITIPGEMLPPPPRKVVIERLPELPDKPQDIHIERWLPFKDIKRRIILNPKPDDPVQCKPRNIIINWEKRKCCNIITNIKNAGVEKVDPTQYLLQHGQSLMTQMQMPEICEEVKKEHNVPLAADHTTPYYLELEGDLHALELFDLDKEGLSEYKYYLNHCKKCNQPNEIVFVQPTTPYEKVVSSLSKSLGSSSSKLGANEAAISSPTEKSNYLNTVVTGNEISTSSEESNTSTPQHITMSFENTNNDEHTNNEQNQSFDEITSEVENLTGK